LSGTLDRFSRDRPRFTDTLDVIKFLCKDMWTLVFRKQIDNLKTNHRVCMTSLEWGAARLTLGSTGSLCSYRQHFQTILSDEYGVFFRSGSTSTTGMDIRHMRKVIALLTACQFLWFPCGVIRGGLASMGINATVHAETSELPAATFQIKTITVKS